MKVVKVGTLAQIRIALAGLPPLLHEIVTRLAGGQSDMDVVGGFATSNELLAGGVDLGFDVLVIGVGHSDVVDLCDQILFEFPRVKIIAIDGDARRVTLYDLRPHKNVVGEVSPEELLEAIRGAVQLAPERS